MARGVTVATKTGLGAAAAISPDTGCHRDDVAHPSDDRMLGPSAVPPESSVAIHLPEGAWAQ